MKRLFLAVPVFAWMALVVQADEVKLKTTPPKREESTCHGTAVEFVETPVEAARLA
jgi:hypothetical protein